MPDKFGAHSKVRQRCYAYDINFHYSKKLRLIKEQRVLPDFFQINFKS